MPIEMPETLKKYGKVIRKGIIANMAPELAKGMLIELLRIRRVDVPTAIKWVEGNFSLWNDLEPEYQKRMKELGHHVGKANWMNFQWGIAAMKDEYPALASLFLGWRKGGNWLARQIEQIKNEVFGG